MTRRDVMLPVEPFRIWMAMIVARHGSVESSQGALGLRARTIRRFVAPKAHYEVEQRRVSLELVDATLCHEGHYSLWDIYPDWDASFPELLFADDDEARPATL